MGLKRPPPQDGLRSPAQISIRVGPKTKNGTHLVDLSLSTGWWIETCLVVATAIYVSSHGRLPHIICTLGLCTASIVLAGVAFGSRHLHFSRSPADSGLLIGSLLIAMTVQASSETDSLSVELVLAWLLSGAVHAKLIVIKLAAIEDQHLSKVTYTQLAYGLAPYAVAVLLVLLICQVGFGFWDHCTLWCWFLFGVILLELLSDLMPESYTLGEAMLMVQGASVAGCHHRGSFVFYLLNPWTSAIELLTYVFSKSEHVYTVIFWVICLVIALPLIARAKAVNVVPDEAESEYRDLALRKRLLHIRKLFHLLATVMFLPIIFYEIDFMRIAFGIALLCFLVLEAIRVLAVPLIGEAVGSYMEAFRDSKDPGPLIITHIYLLLGCAIPIWLQNNASEYSLGIAACGIIAVGIGDACAALYGSQYGRHHWPDSVKTIEGSAFSSFMQLVVVACMVVFELTSLHTAGHLFAGLMVGTLYEAVTMQSDNMVVPMLVYATCAIGEDR